MNSHRRFCNVRPCKLKNSRCPEGVSWWWSNSVMESSSSDHKVSLSSPSMRPQSEPLKRKVLTGKQSLKNSELHGALSKNTGIHKSAGHRRSLARDARRWILTLKIPNDFIPLLPLRDLICARGCGVSLSESLHCLYEP